MAFPDAWMNELLAKNDIVSVISSYVELKPKGRRLWGLCPIHGEKTPSFSVSPDKQLFYCFGCHAGGSVIQFVMDMERLSFPEAVRFLADRSGMAMPEEDDEQILKLRERRGRLYEALKLAARFYMTCLLGPDGVRGREYYRKRGISSEAIKRFGLGYAPPGWDRLKRELTGKGFSIKELTDAGLLVENSDKHSVYDAYRDRAIFPIVGVNGKVLGFGARTLGDDKPKYINTGDTPVYNKRNNLYGLHLLKGEKLSDVIITEGYMDVIGLFHGGINNSVASLGTALTQQQAHLLKRYVENVYIAYDGDSAGQSATLRGLDILKAEGLDVRVIVLPDGLDPDEMIRQRGAEAFETCKREALSLNSFKLLSIKREFSMDDAESREAFTKKACAFIGTLEPVERGRQLEWLSRVSGYTVQVLAAQVEMGTFMTEDPKRRTFGRRIRAPRDEETEDQRSRAEEELLNIMLQSKEAAVLVVETDQSDLFSDPARERFSQRIIQGYLNGDMISAGMLLAEMPEEDRGKLRGVLKDDGVYDDPGKAAEDCISIIRRCGDRERMEQIRERMTGITDDAELARLMQEYSLLKKKLT